MKRALLLLSEMSFLLFLFSLPVKNFKSKYLTNPFRVSCSFPPPPPLSATPFPFVSVHLLARLLLGNFLLAVHPHLSLFLFSLRSDVIRFCGSQLNCTSGLLAILRERSTIQRGRKVRSDMDTSAGVYRIYAQNERESTRTHTYGCEKCLTPSRSYGDSL